MHLVEVVARHQEAVGQAIKRVLLQEAALRVEVIQVEAAVEVQAQGRLLDLLAAAQVQEAVEVKDKLS